MTFHFRECSLKNFPKQKADSREKEHFRLNLIGYWPTFVVQSSCLRSQDPTNELLLIEQLFSK